MMNDPFAIGTIFFIVGLFAGHKLTKRMNNDVIFCKLNFIISKLHTMDITLDDLMAKQDILQATIDATQARVQTGFERQAALIAELRGEIAAGGNKEKLQAIADKMDVANADLQGTVVPGEENP